MVGLHLSSSSLLQARHLLWEEGVTDSLGLSHAREDSSGTHNSPPPKRCLLWPQRQSVGTGCGCWWWEWSLQGQPMDP